MPSFRPLCHGFLAGAEVNLANLQELITKVGALWSQVMPAPYRHSVRIILMSSTPASTIRLSPPLPQCLFLSRYSFSPKDSSFSRKESKRGNRYIFCREKAAMATEIKQRMAALFAVLRYCYLLLVFIPSKRNFTLALARDFRKDRLHAAGNMAGSQPVLCHYPHSCCDVGICRSCTPWKSDFHTSQDRYRYGFGRIGIPFHDCILDHQRLSFGRGVQGSPGCRGGRSQDRTVGALRTLLLPDCGRAVHFSSRSVVRL